MNALARTSRWLSVAAISVGLSFVSGMTVGAEGGGSRDVLNQPARLSERAKSAVLTGVAAAGKRLVAVGERSIVLLSDDDGQRWRQAKSVPTSVALVGVRFASEKIGWAVGHSGVVLKTSDGGETWALQLDGKQAAEIELAAANAAAAGTEKPTRRQRDAQGLVADGADKPFLDAYFFDEMSGFVIGAYGLAFSTSDGGKTWASLVGQIDNPKSRHLYNVAGDSQFLLIAGEQGNLLRSNDRGQHFAVMPISYPGTLFGAVVSLDKAIVVFGLRGNAFRSTDQGQSWKKVDLGLPVTLTAGIRLRDSRLAVVDETGRLLLSSDGGASFVSQSVPKMNAATGIVEADDGALVVSTQHGAVRIAPEVLRAEQSK